MLLKHLLPICFRHIFQKTQSFRQFTLKTLWQIHRQTSMLSHSFLLHKLIMSKIFFRPHITSIQQK